MALGYPAAMDSYNAIALLRHALAGLRLPVRSLGLQAMVTEPVRPVLDTVVASAGVAH